MVKECREDIIQTNKIFENLKSFWQETADEIDGIFKLSSVITYNRGVNDSFNLKIFKKYHGINIELSSNFKTVSLEKDSYLVSDLKIQTSLANQLDFHLFIWKKKKLTKLFSWNKQNSGFKDFDRRVEFRTNREGEVQNFLSTKEIRAFFVQQNEILFKIQFEDKLLKINYQSNNIARDKEVLLTEYFRYEKLIDGLINAGLINHSGLQ